MRIPHFLFLTVLVLLQFATSSAEGADLLEPWERGFTDAEIFVALGEEEPAGAVGVLGFGLSDSISFGISFGAVDGEPSEAGLFLMASRSLGRFGELDVFAELLSGTSEVELSGAERSLGVEWSAATAGPMPYARLSVVDHEGGTSWHPLLGLRLPIGQRLELHFELSGEEPDHGSWPLHFAVGPNWRIHEALELTPEVSVLHDRNGGGTRFFFTVGLIFDPRAVFGEPQE